jgi:transcriptional regulator of arginine metabolism
LTAARFNEYYFIVVNSHPHGLILRRRGEIVRLVREGSVRSQEELQRLLADAGFDATQPTLSRDVRELGLVKTSRGYSVPGENEQSIGAEQRLERLSRVVADSVLSVKAAGTLVVLKTPPAGAHPVARALDEAGLAEAVGTIAGDDTVFVAASGDAAARALVARLSTLATAPSRRRRG